MGGVAEGVEEVGNGVGGVVYGIGDAGGDAEGDGFADFFGPHSGRGTDFELAFDGGKGGAEFAMPCFGEAVTDTTGGRYDRVADLYGYVFHAVAENPPLVEDSLGFFGGATQCGLNGGHCSVEAAFSFGGFFYGNS